MDADQYVAEMGQLASALGVESPPTTEAELAEAFDSFSDEVAGGPDARAVAKFLRFPGRALPIGAWGPYEVLVRSATDLLPSWAHEVLGTSARPVAVERADSAVCATTLRSLQAILGPRSRAVELAYRRLGIDPDATPPRASERSR